MCERFCIRFLLCLMAIFAFSPAHAFTTGVRTEIVTPGTFSKSTVKDLETLSIKLSGPGYIEKAFVAVTFKTPMAKLIVSVNGRPRGEISSPLRTSDLEIDVRDTASSIEFYSAAGVAEIDGVIVTVASAVNASSPSVGGSLTPAPAAVSPMPIMLPSDILRVLKTADRDLETLSRYLQPEEILRLVVPVQSAIREVQISIKAGRPMADVLPRIRLLKTELLKLEPIVTRMRAVSSRTERELANSIYIWSVDVQGLAD